VTRYIGPDKLPLLPSQFPMIEGSWTWLRKANDSLHRETRLDASQLLMTAFKQGGYAARCGGRTQMVKFSSLKQLREGTRVISLEDPRTVPQLPPNLGTMPMLDYYAGGSHVERAVELTREGFQVAVVSAASSYKAGGGFVSGGRHALEEALCTQSTLYHSLEGVVQGYERQRQAYRIPDAGCIVSPRVEFFRRGTDQGYPIYGGDRTLPVAAVVSIAMYNLNPQVRDSPVDAPTDQAQYENGVLRKFEALAIGAIAAGADALVLCDVGCGVFRNDPAVVGALAGRSLRTYIHYFKCIVFTGQRRFHDAAMESLTQLTLQRRRADAAPTSGLAPSSKCQVCGQPLGRDLAVILGPTGERVLLTFLHESCSELLTDQKDGRWRGYTAMALPRAAETPEEFLRALDIDGSGTISKAELRCVITALLGTEPDPKQFEERWLQWDKDGSGDLDIGEIRKMKSRELEPERLSTRQLPHSLLDWVRQHSAVDPSLQVNPSMSMPPLS